MIFSRSSVFFVLLSMAFLVVSCVSGNVPSAELQVPDIQTANVNNFSGFTAVDGSRRLTFPKDFGAHEDFRTEWWYYTVNLQTAEGRHFGIELTIFRVGLTPPTAELPSDSKWYSHSLYFAHFAVSDIVDKKFYAFERYSRPGPGLAGAQADPYRVWLEDWNITGQASGKYRLQAAQAGTRLDLTLNDEMGAVLQGENGYSRGGKNITNAAYYYSQPRLRADGTIQLMGTAYQVSGLAWMDHEFSSGLLDESQIGWDWFSLHFEDGRALMLFQLRERNGGISASSSGTFISKNGIPQLMQDTDFKINVLDRWRSPHTNGRYPSAWDLELDQPDCQLTVQPWMADQELHFPAVTYWEGAVHFDGICGGVPARGNGYVELTGYVGTVPLP